MREVRFSIDRDWAPAAHGEDGFDRAHPISNSFGGWPSAVGIAPYLILRIVVSGRPDETTGYLINIQELDRLLRNEAIPRTARRLSVAGVGLTGEALLSELWHPISAGLGRLGENAETPRRGGQAARRNAERAGATKPRSHEGTKGITNDEMANRRVGRPFDPPLGQSDVPRDGGSIRLTHPTCGLERLELWTTPYVTYAIQAGSETMVELTQCFEFSASHRLHVPALSDEENRQCFGKCNNPNGHGHNYRVEVTIGREIGDERGTVLPLPAFEAIVKEGAIDRLDHKHLNADVPEFAAVNPSVENIARTVWEYLSGKFAPAALLRVRVWETPKTYAEYAG